MKKDRESIAELVSGYRKAKILFTAAAMDLFSLTGGKGQDAAAISRKLGAAQRSTEILLNALAGMGFLKKSGGRYSNSPAAARYLVPGKREYVGHNLQYQNIIWNAWSDLETVIRTGKTEFPLRGLLEGRQDFLNGYIRGMADIARKPAAEIAACLDLSKARCMLDVGGGPGTYTAAFLNKEKNLAATILDLPETLRITRENFAGGPLAGRVLLQAGDYHTTDFGQDSYHLVLLSHVTHDEGGPENLNLLRKAYRALRPGGRVVVHDFMLDREMTAPEFSALFSVHMLVYTNKGRVYSAGEYKDWLKKAGFRRPQERVICGASDNASRILVAVK